MIPIRGCLQQIYTIAFILAMGFIAIVSPVLAFLSIRDPYWASGQSFIWLFWVITVAELGVGVWFLIKWIRDR